ncbi:MAG TPA: ABC transporter permease [Firmicutes bacterium]|nr:ABC transporter permease [Bacillota bacterium]
MTQHVTTHATAQSLRTEGHVHVPPHRRATQPAGQAGSAPTEAQVHAPPAQQAAHAASYARSIHLAAHVKTAPRTAHSPTHVCHSTITPEAPRLRQHTANTGPVQRYGRVGRKWTTCNRTVGLAERVVIYKHALKNALIPVVTVVGLTVGRLLGGAVLTETIFSWPGLGKFAVDAIYARDYPQVQGVVLLIASGFVVINLLVDIAYVFLDPRIRYQ